MPPRPELADGAAWTERCEVGWGEVGLGQVGWGREGRGGAGPGGEGRVGAGPSDAGRDEAGPPKEMIASYHTRTISAKSHACIRRVEATYLPASQKP